MATSESGLRTSIVFAAAYQLPASLAADRLKDIGPTWGSWKTWTMCATDNVICHDLSKARELHQRAIQAVCNFYVPQKFYQSLNRPNGINFYHGDFLPETDNLEDIIAMHLVAEQSDIVLLFGFDASSKPAVEDPLQRHIMLNRLGLIRQALIRNSEVQWILVDHPKSLDPAFGSVANLTCDSLKNVLTLLN